MPQVLLLIQIKKKKYMDRDKGVSHQDYSFIFRAANII